MTRSKPNFLITGTPGVGKTTFSDMISNIYGLVHVPVSRLIAEKHLYTEEDKERDCTIYDEDKLDEEVERILDENPDGGVIFDFHCCDIVRNDDVDYVIVLRCTSDILYKRLEGRSYSQPKIQENVEAEIFNVIIDEVLEEFEDFNEENIIQFTSDKMEDLDKLAEIVGELINKFNQV